MKVHFQKGWMYEGDRRFGFIVDRKNNERKPTIDICWWWGWVMIWFSNTGPKTEEN